mmetsp:Transcript_16433/g.14118  ORF Transcript_16433/g.14118 Transcript_16433/m.14118 type:complete len:121 (+) Transcript_16433:479-841(+)
MAPPSMSGTLGGLAKSSFMFGMIIAYGLCFMLPVQPIYNDNTWKVMFLFPAGTSLLRMCFYLFFHKHDSPKFYCMSNDYNSMCNALKWIYKGESHYRKTIQALEAEKNSNKNGKKLSLLT